MEYRTFRMSDEKTRISKLALADYEEVGAYPDKIQPNIDWDSYLRMDDMGMLLCCGAYDGETLVGYYVSVIAPYFHSKDEIFATSDALWIHPDHRGSTGVRLIKYHEDMCRKLGVSVMAMNFTMRNDISPLMEKLGWDHLQKTYSKYIKE